MQDTRREARGQSREKEPLPRWKTRPRFDSQGSGTLPLGPPRGAESDQVRISLPCCSESHRGRRPTRAPPFSETNKGPAKALLLHNSDGLKARDGGRTALRKPSPACLRACRSRQKQSAQSRGSPMAPSHSPGKSGGQARRVLGGKPTPTGPCGVRATRRTRAC